MLENSLEVVPRMLENSQENQKLHYVTTRNAFISKEPMNQVTGKKLSFPNQSSLILVAAKHQINNITAMKIPISRNQNEINQMIVKRFSSRNRRIRRICSQRWMKKLKIVNPIRSTKGIFAAGRLRWCPIPKVGSTFFQSMNRLLLAETTSTYSVPFNKRKRFYIVREPYSRLLSGYMDKLVTFPTWWTGLGKFIIKNFRPNATVKDVRCGCDVTFPEFVKYFINSYKTGIQKNSHFVPMYEACNTCRRFFDFVVHLETVKDDISYLLKYVNISTSIPSMSDDIQTLRSRSGLVFKHRLKFIECMSICTALGKVWWFFQVSGIISKELSFVLEGNECERMDIMKFLELTQEAYQRSIQIVNRREQRREFLVENFLQVPLADRMQVRNILAPDFKLFGYEAQPDDIFPELAKKKVPHLL